MKRTSQVHHIFVTFPLFTNLQAFTFIIFIFCTDLLSGSMIKYNLLSLAVFMYIATIREAMLCVGRCEISDT
jgi:hypothetical protein